MINNNSSRSFFTPGTSVLFAVMVIGYLFGLARLIVGLGPVTNLTNQYPWGLWIGVDVASGVALAAGGFTTAAIINIFGRKKYHALERPALLTAWLGYAFVGTGLMFDLGRYYNIWHPAIYWQGNSVLFEVGMCVMFYLAVLTVEFSPAIIEGILNYAGRDSKLGRLATSFQKPLSALRLIALRVMPLFVIAGVVLSCMHQSSLGSLMLIAPTKLSNLWWTPMLPVLFLLSAIMVGFPMVIFESIIVAKSFGRKPEMELLTPFSRLIPWFIAVYAIVKFGDLTFRWDELALFSTPKHTVAFFVEICLTIVIPFVMLLLKSVRRSPFWLFVAVTSIILGVVLNRVNVFLVGFTPPFATVEYFPSIGEIALTAALISTIMFLYRFFAYYFPVIEGHEVAVISASEKQTPVTVWVARVLVILLFCSFVILYAFAHQKGIQESVVKLGDVTRIKDKVAPKAIDDPIAVIEQVSFSAKTMPTLLMLNRQPANEKVDDYGPSRFMHKAHAARLGGNCSVCHHRVQNNKEDRIGVELKFTDMDERKPASCVACHQYPNESDFPMRPGLKGAYHAQCISCHEKVESKNAPTTCIGCHDKHIPDHKDLIQIVGKPKPQEVTARCLECHETVGQDILKTSHWTWEGSSPNTVGHEHRMDIGKKNIVNNYCIHIKTNEPRCSQCHIGFGWKDDSFDFNDPKNIDCLICHDTTGIYAKDTTNGGMPKKEVDIVKVAQKVGKTSRQTCGKCHFYGGGGANVKHGDLEPALVNPSEHFDVHMGRANLDCQDCHRTKDHRIAGQCLAIPTSEGRVSCEQCHGDKPHSLNKSIGFHLDKHAKSVACQTCHIPNFAKKTPTKMHWDWSTAGQDLPSKKDQYNMPTFMKKKGSFVWGMNVDPDIAWYNGKHTRHLLEDKVADTSHPILLNGPVGSIKDFGAKLYPFKRFTGVQPFDAENRNLVIPNLWKGFWKDFDWEKCVAKGMGGTNLPFSGKLEFVNTEMFWAINHEVVPADKAMHCADCHQANAVTCASCHDKEPDFDSAKMIKALYPESKAKWKRSDFKQMGYDGDPAITGGRFHNYTLPGTKQMEKQ